MIYIPVSPDQTGLPALGYPLTRTDPMSFPDDNNATGDLDIFEDAAGYTVTIVGVDDGTTKNPAYVEVFADWKKRTIFSVEDRLIHALPTAGGTHAVDVTIENVGFGFGARGYSTIAGSAGGGCIATEEGSLTLRDAEVFGCSQSNGPGGGAIHAIGPFVCEDSTVIQNMTGDSPGGGILAEGDVTIERCVVEGNFASGASRGGGLAVDSTGSVVITDSEFASNSASGGNGGGAHLAASTVSIADVDFNTNDGVLGGGLYLVAFDAASGTPVIDRSSFTSNRGGLFGAGLQVEANAAYPNREHLVANSTFAGNHIGIPGIGDPPAPGFQEGVAVRAGTVAGPGNLEVRLRHCTIDENLYHEKTGSGVDSHHRPLSIESPGGTLSIERSIVDGRCHVGGGGGTHASSGGNTIWDGTGCTTVGTDDVRSPPRTPFVAFSSSGYLVGNTWMSDVLSFIAGPPPPDGWVISDFNGRTCDGSISQNGVTRPSSGTTCYSGSWQP